jgi:hypothetical protein
MHIATYESFIRWCGSIRIEDNLTDAAGMGDAEGYGAAIATIGVIQLISDINTYGAFSYSQ